MNGQNRRAKAHEPGRYGPGLASVWLGRSLHEARRAAGLTLADAATCLASNTGTMSRYESGRLPAKPEHVETLLTRYGVHDMRRRTALVELSHEARRRDWWDRYGSDLGPEYVDHAWLDDRASAIRSYDTMTFAALVQTPEFAEAEIRGDPDIPCRHIALAVEFRNERQRVFAKARPPRMSIVLDECVLYRPIVEPGVMAGQLHRIIELIESGTLDLRVLPTSVWTQGERYGGFQVFDLPEPYPKVGYAETIAGPVYVESEGVDRFVRIYNELHTAALGPRESARLVEKAAGELVPVSSGKS